MTNQKIIKNHICYCFGNIIKFEDFELDNTLAGKKSHENVLVYNISYKTLIGAKPISIRFDKVNRFIRIFDGNRLLASFEAEKYDLNYNWIGCFIGLKRSITYVISHNYAKIKVDSCESLPVEKTVTFCNVIVLNKSVVNKVKNNYYDK